MNWMNVPDSIKGLIMYLVAEGPGWTEPEYQAFVVLLTTCVLRHFPATAPQAAQEDGA